MRLQSIKYSQFDGQPNEWNLDNLELLGTNLIVGRNATGKTRILNCLNLLAKLLCGEFKPGISSAFDAQFEDSDGEHYRYKLKIEKKAVVEEIFSKGSEEFLTRSKKGMGEIYAEKESRRIKFQSPDSELAFFSRRDSLQHSYFEPLYKWAKSVHYYPFGTPLGRETFSIQKDSTSTETDTKNFMGVVDIYRKGEEKLGSSFKNAIIEDLKQINYDVSDIGVKQPSRINFINWAGPMEVFGLWVKESDLKSETEQSETSQGMFRVISLIIQLNYLKMTGEPGSCILVDDIGEGLDYERSCALIKLIMKKAENSQFQLIMATNDRFVMNEVPLEYWTVLHREGKRCRVFNIKNSKEKFEEFRFTGLNNFDFFSSDYLIEQ